MVYLNERNFAETFSQYDLKTEADIPIEYVIF
jgi:hypothetical protein